VLRFNPGWAQILSFENVKGERERFGFVLGHLTRQVVGSLGSFVIGSNRCPHLSLKTQASFFFIYHINLHIELSQTCQ